MHMGKHVYGQKPLAHDLYEVRRMTETRASEKVVTQMGIQIHSAEVYRTGVRDYPERHHREDQGSPFLVRKIVGRSRRPSRTAPIPCRPIWIGTSGWASAPSVRSSASGYYHR